MKRVSIQDAWPASWKRSYYYDLEEVYDEVSQRGYAYAYENRRNITLRLLTDVLPKGARILDVAAGQGNFSLSLAELGYDVTWNDLRGDLAEYVRLKHEFGKITFAPGNAFELDYSGQFDAVLITEVIEHVAHPDDLLTKTAEFVKPGGYIVMTTPNGAYIGNTLPKFSECADPSVYEKLQYMPDSDGHIFLLHPDEVKALGTRAGLQLDKFLLFTNPLTCGWFKMGILLKSLPRTMVDYLEETTQRLPQRVQAKTLVHLGARFLKPRKPLGVGSDGNPQVQMLELD
jgi:2-polyprenyl-3-methyl-5-hydroxy-6-metoxy-1,4-benzoquinol methylase